MIRIFTAFPIRNEWSESFLHVSKNNSHINNIRWTPQANLHITLFFIGEIEEENLEEVKNILENVFKNQQSFSLEFESIEIKGKKNSSMVWAQFRKNNSFTELSEKIYQSVKNLMTIKRTHEDPIPHCTLARIKGKEEVSRIDKNISLKQSILEIDSAELWKTVQSKEGVRYESLQKYNLRM